MSYFDSFCSGLNLRLKDELPGDEVRKKMAPSARFIVGKEGNHKRRPRESAVLILLYLKDGEIHIPLIKRVEDGSPHSGQVSFPGGGKEKFDGNIIETALREGQEEIGVNAKNIRVLGTLTELYIPVSNYNVTPVIGYLEDTPQFDIEKKEVDYVIECKLPYLFKNENKGRETLYRHGVSIDAPYYLCGEEKIWGATAMILSEFEALYCEVINKL